jgi:predicted  nucleic acid-binding Zn-ribbon protein
MRKQGKLFQRRMAQMHHEHERDLANVVLAYDARTETLEQRCKQYQTLEVQTKRLLKKCRDKNKSQQETMAGMRSKISMLKRQRSKASSPGRTVLPASSLSLPGGGHTPQSVIGSRGAFVAILPGKYVALSPPAAAGDYMGWISPGSGSDDDMADSNPRQSGLSLLSDPTTAGHAKRDRDWNSASPGAAAGSSAEHFPASESGEGGSPETSHRMREEIRQYQEALAESAQTIDDLRKDNLQEVGRLRDSETGLQNLVKSLELSKDQAETSLLAASTKSAAAHEELMQTKSSLRAANTEIESFLSQASRAQAERAKMQRNVEESETKINAQLREVALTMKQTLKQCHMLEELIRPEITCNHCMEILKDAQVLYPCGHSFCDACVDEMERESDQCIVCSLCQTVVPRADSCPNVALQAICPRVAWWSEPIALLKKQFQEFSGRDFVVQQTFGTMPTVAGAEHAAGGGSVVAARADATTIQMLVRVALAIQKAGVGVAELFERFDTDHGGSVDSKEMEEGLHSIGMWLTAEEFERLMRCADPDGDGDVMYTEFAELLDHALMTRDGRDAGAARKASALDPVVEAARRRGY